MRRFEPWFVIIAGLASIVSLLLQAFDNQARAKAAFAIACVVLFAIGARILWYLQRQVTARYPKGYNVVSCLQTYSTADGVHISHDVYRHIQCKRALMTEVTHNFKWTGSKEPGLPDITSHLQRAAGLHRGRDGEFDSIVLILQRALLYNDIAVLHIRTQLDDTDRRSEPQLTQKIDAPIQVFESRAELGHVSGQPPAATLTRRRIDTSIPSNDESLGHLAFDMPTRSYRWQVVNPDAGYFYKMEWVRS